MLPRKCMNQALWKGGGELNVSAKSIDPCQPAQSAQADMGRNLLPIVQFLHVQVLVYVMMQSVV